MTAAEMARIYALAFPEARAWSETEISGLIDGPGGFVVERENGFAIGRAIAGEVELITIAVDPSARRKGAGRALLSDFEAEAQVRAADTGFLEVAEDNVAARALYLAAGWSETGRRRAYYKRAGTAAVDAILMGKTLD